MKNQRLLLAISVLFIVIAVVALIPIPSLEVVARDSAAHLISLPAVAEDEFTIRYLHSVARRPVDENFEIQADGVLKLMSTEWDMNGAGLPYGPEGTMVFNMSEGRYSLTNINRSFPQIIQAVGTVAHHELIFQGRSLPLEKLTPPGTAVRIRSAAIPSYRRLYDHIRWLMLSHPLP